MHLHPLIAKGIILQKQVPQRRQRAIADRTREGGEAGVAHAGRVPVELHQVGHHPGPHCRPEGLRVPERIVVHAELLESAERTTPHADSERGAARGTEHVALQLERLEPRQRAALERTCEAG